MALIAVKESDLERIEVDLIISFNHYQAMRKIVNRASPGNRDSIALQNVHELRAVIEDLLLSIRLTENELHDMIAPGWE